MSNRTSRKPIALAVGAALAAGFTAAQANEADPFSAVQLSQAYMLSAEEGKCGEGKCGGKKEGEKAGEKAAEGKCGEGKCGGMKEGEKGDGKAAEGKCGGKK